MVGCEAWGFALRDPLYATAASIVRNRSRAVGPEGFSLPAPCFWSGCCRTLGLMRGCTDSSRHREPPHGCPKQGCVAGTDARQPVPPLRSPSSRSFPSVPFRPFRFQPLLHALGSNSSFRYRADDQVNPSIRPCGLRSIARFRVVYRAHVHAFEGKRVCFLRIRAMWSQKNS